MRVDAVRLAQALANLIGNAVDAVDRGGCVELVARGVEKEMVFEVLDNGPGIHLEPGEDPFQPFFTRKEDGTGLGLAIVQRIVGAHHGNVAFSNREGGGTRFEVRVPLELGAVW
jgi:signal transduction histidine kinase